MDPYYQFEWFGITFYVNQLVAGGLVFLVAVGILIAQLRRVWRTDEEKLRRKLRAKDSRPPKEDHANRR